MLDTWTRCLACVPQLHRRDEKTAAAINLQRMARGVVARRSRRQRESLRATTHHEALAVMGMRRISNYFGSEEVSPRRRCSSTHCAKPAHQAGTTTHCAAPSDSDRTCGVHELLQLWLSRLGELTQLQLASSTDSNVEQHCPPMEESIPQPPLDEAKLEAARSASCSCCVLDEASVAAGTCTLETRDVLPLPRLCVVTKPHALTEPDLLTLLQCFERTLQRGSAFTILWDLRTLRAPSRAAIKEAIDFMGKPERQAAIDDLNQAVVVIVKSPVSAAMARMCIGMCKPPVPVHIVRGDEEALAKVAAAAA